MNSAVASVRSQLDFDRKGIELATLFSFVLVATTALALRFQSLDSAIKPPEAFGDGASGEAAAAATWAIAEVGLAVVLLLIIYGMRYLPPWLQTTVRRSGAIAVLVWLGGASGSVAGTVLLVGIIVGVYAFYRVADHYGVWWLPNNLLSAVGAIAGGMMLGMLFGAVGLAIASIVLLIYDHYFANKKDWMFDLAGPIVKYRLPALFIRPSEWRFDWRKLHDETEDTDATAEEKEDEDRVIGWGLGTADMMLPAGFVAAVALDSNGIVSTFGNVALVVFIAAVALACFRLSWRMNHKGSGAGLPSLATAVVVPYVALTAASMAL